MHTARLAADNPVSRAQAVREAAALLRQKAVVALPTETVYGLAVIADDAEAEARLREVRGRDEDKPFTVALAEAKAASRYVDDISALGRRLMSRCWPGPLTIVFERADGGTIGLRVPAHDLTRAVITKAGGALLLPSANRPGEEPARDAAGVLAAFDGQIAAVVDGGAVELARPSTVVRLALTSYEILRQGALSENRVRRAANLVILFVCSGNSCRSPMAEGLARKLLAEQLAVDPENLEKHGYTVLSGGTAGGFAAPASPQAVRVMQEMGVDLTGHLSQTVSEAMLTHADRIFAMTPEQMHDVLRLAPDAAGRVMLLDPRGRAIGDPHGGDVETYRRCALVIQEAIRKRIREL